jgi:enoyl-CoA hydratase/carnithine racemase
LWQSKASLLEEIAMEVLTEITNNVLVITLNRPEAGNALNGALSEGLSNALNDAATNAEVRAIVITGAGEKVFCAGMDLKAFAAGEDIAKIGLGFAALRQCKKPLIAAVNGHALAGGFEVVLFCDLIVSVETARFGIPEVKRGLFAAGGGVRLPARIPMAVAMEMGLTGDPISADRAKELGLINEVVPAAGLRDAALALAGRVSANGPLAVQATKQLMLDEIGGGNPALLGELQKVVFSSEDAKEGSIAFAQKRAPEWKGR